MRQGITRIGRWRVGFVLAALSFAGAAWAGQVSSVALEQGATGTGTRAEVQLQGAGQYKTLSLSDPHRLVLDLPDSQAVRGLQLPAPTGVVTAVRTGQPVPGTFRIVFELAAPVAALPLRVEPSSGGARLLIEWPGDGPASSGASVATGVATAAPSPAEAVPAAASSGNATPPPQDPRSEAARATALLTAQVTEALNRPAATGAPGEVPPSGTTVSPQAILEGRAASAAAAATTAPATAGVAAQDGVAASSAAPAPVATQAPAPAPPRPAISAAGMRTLVVAIDAGHGGQDPGAIGPTGKREKDVTLAMARELARQVNATPGLKAFLVRDSDVFLPLPMRAQRARAAKADIFVSIHADAAENRNARGSSVYVLSTKGASSQRARWLADKENAADLVGGVRLQQTENVLASVLLDLAQSGHMRASEDAANHVLGGLKRVGNNHKPNIERANFAVLRTADMPAMLVETAFISNAEEEKRLVDPAYQRKVAGAVVDGINTYFTRQPPPGTLFAARAEAESLAMAGGGTP
ncbi:N-acetylmuramoyl-L-alanine amidase [Pseudoxanthomonas suwonensis]|uniref:N-acetylmuramoyl-L-alanine amidase AmiC n=1 Tax=Pseudoxanthomonas suwonensis TaxID=314722 RepID=A0A0E3YZV4_9GAMM|nr:N-acetylmuramoyl-L-alanine amidase [Pseudoxanthomonas suwonensis]AKC85697.1 N-acetylmuramoyl-L-alanine amidase [Pseudoxanthomonas suwonensis]